MERSDQPREACLFVCMTGRARVLSRTVRSRPHLEHLLDVILVLGIYDTIHIPLEDFDQVPAEDPESTEL